MPATLTKVSSGGMLDSDDFNRANNTVVGGNWVERTGTAFVVGSNTLRCNSGVVNLIEGVPPGLGVERWVRWKYRVNDALKPATRTYFNFDWNAGSIQGYYIFASAGSGGLINITKSPGAIILAASATGIGTFGNMTSFEAYFRNGEQKVWTEASNTILSSADTDFDDLAGTVAMRHPGGSQPNTAEWDDYELWPTKYVRITGLPEGYTVRVRNSVGGVIKSEVAGVGGTVEISLSPMDGAVLEMPTTGWFDVQVLDDEMVETVVYSDTPILAGDIFLYQGMDFGPWIFEITEGSLAPGHSLNPSTGYIEGTATQAGRFCYRWRVYNDNISTDPIECCYNVTTDDIGFPRSNAIWRLDFNKLISGGGASWWRDSRRMNRPAVVERERIIFVDTSLEDSGQVVEVDRATFAPAPYWTSPVLNRANRMGTYTLVQVSLKLEGAGSSLLEVEASINGGLTWLQPEAQQFVQDSLGQILRRSYAFNITGTDLRFRVKLPSDTLVRIHSWRAWLLDRGELFDFVSATLT